MSETFLLLLAYLILADKDRRVNSPDKGQNGPWSDIVLVVRSTYIVRMKQRTLAQMVRDARGKITQEAFAELTGVSRSTIANIESGATKVPEKPTLERLAATSSLTMEDMYRAIGRLSQSEEMDIRAEFRRIRAMPDLKEQMQAMENLPEDVFEMIEVMAHRLLQERLRSTGR